jgi:putative ATP-dependent endonuclease of the OLD family
MHINRVYIDGFKRLTRFALPLNESLNVIVGDNETGKSTVLEALGLVLTGQFEGRLIQYAIDPYLFNMEIVKKYFKKRQGGENMSPPHILIEAYLQYGADDPELAKLRGTNNSKSEDCAGLAMTIEVDSDHLEALKDYAGDDSNPTVLPVEFYKVNWRSFAGNRVTLWTLPFRAKMIDTSHARVYRGPTKWPAPVSCTRCYESRCNANDVPAFFLRCFPGGL